MAKMNSLFIFFVFLISVELKANEIFKSIYNLDDRELITENTDPKILELSKSIGLIFFEDDLIEEQDNYESTILAGILSGKPPIGRNYCATERFANHHAYKRSCSGFLIAKDIMITAGHCFKSKNDCHRKLITFEAYAETENDKGFKIHNNDIFGCEKIIAQEYDPYNTLKDYAIIKLNKKADRIPLKFRQAKKIEDNAKLFMIGHPLGLPKVYSRGASILDNSEEVYFKASLDSFHGNSGSPVFNVENNFVEGVLVRGEIDEVLDETNKCNKYATYPEDDTSKGESVTRMSILWPSIFNQLSELIEN